jgi:hypothetical protein
MDDHGEHVAVSRVAVLNQVSVLVLGDDPESPPLPTELAAAIDGPSRVVVVDCLAIRRLGHATRDAIVMAHRGLSRERRRLIVVNAPVSEVPPLREHGVDVAATVDQDFASPSTSGYAHGQFLI